MAMAFKCDLCNGLSEANYGSRTVYLANGVEVAEVKFEVGGRNEPDLCKKCSDIKMLELADAVLKKMQRA